MRIKPSVYLAAAFVMASLWGCGSNMDSGGDQTKGTAGNFGTDAAGIKYVGASTCINCHKDMDLLDSKRKVADFLQSKHVIHSTHVTAASGACLECHDPIRDGRTLEGMINPADVPADGLAAVTCETCHGAGGVHYGEGKLPSSIPDYAICGNCHNADFPHVTYHPEAGNIVEDYVNGGHFAGEDSHNSNVCSKCHTDEGARLYKDVDTASGLETVVLAVPSPSHPVQCRTCHNPHNPGELLETATSSASAEYRTCTNCHQAHDANVGTEKRTLAGSTSTDGASKDGDLIYHATRWNRIITTTHYDNPATPTKIEGYAMSKTNERACRDCHNVHAADITINEEWAESGHGGKIAAAKAKAREANLRTIAEVIAVKAAGSVDTPSTDVAFAPAWTHYDWDHTYKADGAKDRADCQRCHTATGTRNFLTSPTAYDPANNDFSHLVGWKLHTSSTDLATKPSGQNELLYCYGCHKYNSGALLEPGAFTAAYKFRALDGTLAAAKYPNVGATNVCIPCHSGLESGASVVALTTAGNSFTNVSFVNSHYMAAAGTMYVKIGYTNFIDPSTVIGTSTYGKSLTSTDDGGAVSSTHRKLGTTAINGDSHNPTFFVPGNLDSNGPCVVCHMSDKHHTLEMDEYAFNNVCVKCHDEEGGVALTAENFVEIFIDEQAVPFENALALAKAKLAAAPYNMEYDPANYPYFFTAGTAHVRENGVTDWTRGGALTAAEAEKLMGACFNINVLSRDPAAYVHARTYTRRLLYDSIDWLDDKTINMSVGATAFAWNPTIYAGFSNETAADATESLKYLKGYNRTSLVWNALERP